MADVDWDLELPPGLIQNAVTPVLKKRIAALTRKIATQARMNAPVRTGNLGRSIVEDPIVMSGPFRVESGVTATAPYAAAVHDGTRPHVIRPRNGNVLRFEIGSRVVFAKSVHHPGTKARPFLRNAAEQVLRQP